MWKPSGLTATVFCAGLFGLLAGCGNEAPPQPSRKAPPPAKTEPGKPAGTAETPKPTQPGPAVEPAKPEPPKPEPVKPEPAPAAELKPGLLAEFFKFADGEEPNFLPADHKKKPDVTKVHAQVNFESVDGAFAESGLEDKFHTVWAGVIRIEKAGSYKFYLNSDDGSKLKIDGKDVVDNGGLHGMEEKDGTVELTAGDHAIVVEFFENDGGAGCVLSWEPAGDAKEVVPAKVLFHKEAPAAK